MKRALQAAGMLGLLLLIIGCGLEDYERKMVRAQTAAQSFDDANKALGDALTLPAITEKRGTEKVNVQPPFFIRPPLGISRTDDGKPHDGIVYHFPRGTKIARPATKAGPDKTKAPETKDPSAMLTDVYVVLAYNRKDWKGFIGEVLQRWDQDAVKARARQGKTPAGAEAVEVLEFDVGEAGYSSFFMRGESGRMLGVVYRFAKENRNAARKVIDLSVDWIGLGAQANVLREKFGRVVRAPAAGPPPIPGAQPPGGPPPPNGELLTPRKKIGDL